MLNMETYTGIIINPLKIRKEDVTLIDTARSLSMQCRFNGHVETFFSVANHCVNMANWFYKQKRYTEAKYALFHEIDEIYYGDVISPVKALEILAPLRELIKKSNAVGYKKFNLKPKTPKSIKILDDKMKILEARKVKPNSLLAKQSVDGKGIQVKVLSREDSEKEFLKLYNKIEKKLNSAKRY